MPLLRTDPYGKFIPDPPTASRSRDAVPARRTVHVCPARLARPSTPARRVRTGHAFLDDIAHTASPLQPDRRAADADGDSVVGADAAAAGTYDNELLDRHFITGDGRGNENIGLTAVHHVFHSEHNRQVDEIKATILASGDAAFIASWQLSPTASWNGERLFQAARFATEMQYQHLVFEEFARKIQPTIDEFLRRDQLRPTIDPAIFAEFAHVVYPLRPLDADRDGRPASTRTSYSSDIALIEAFLNPLAFDNERHADGRSRRPAPSCAA